jgi:hypothetical protein
MRHLPGSELTKKQALDWGKYVGVDDDGSARVFKKEPVKAGGTWIPDKFPSQMYPACYRLEETFPERFHGRKLVRTSEDGEKFYRPEAQ